MVLVRPPSALHSPPCRTTSPRLSKDSTRCFSTTLPTTGTGMLARPATKRRSSGNEAGEGGEWWSRAEKEADTDRGVTPLLLALHPCDWPATHGAEVEEEGEGSAERKRQRKTPVGQCQRAQRDFSSVLRSFHSPEDMVVTVLHSFRSPCLHPVRLRCCEQPTNNIVSVCLSECVLVCVCVFVFTQKKHCEIGWWAIYMWNRVVWLFNTRGRRGGEVLIYVCKYLFILI